MRTAARNLLLFGMLSAAATLAACSQGGEAGDSTNSEPSLGEPTTTRASSPTPEASEAPQYALLEVAPNFTLPSANGAEVTLSQLSAEKPVVLVFYRAFW